MRARAVVLGVGAGAALVREVLGALRRAGLDAIRGGTGGPGLRADTFGSREGEAGAFLVVEEAAPASEVWVHARAGEASRRAGDGAAAALGDGRGPAPVRRGEVPLLAPHWHAPGAAVCLVRVAPDPAAGPARDAALAEALADALARALAPSPTRDVDAAAERFDVWHEVPLVPQRTGMSCWAAAAAMLVGWRDCVDVDPALVARAAGRWEAYGAGLDPEDVTGLARTFGLAIEPPRDYGVLELRELLERRGPLWVGEASPGLHVVVVAGLHGDGTADGTRVRVADPWPEARGERYEVTFRAWRRNLVAGAALSGGGIQVLHCGGRARGRRGSAPTVTAARSPPRSSCR